MPQTAKLFKISNNTAYHDSIHSQIDEIGIILLILPVFNIANFPYIF